MSSSSLRPGVAPLRRHLRRNKSHLTNVLAIFRSRSYFLLVPSGSLARKHTIDTPANVSTFRFPPSPPQQVALCALAQLFIVVTHPPLVRLLVLETLGSGDGDGARGSGSAAEPGAGSSAPLLALLQGDREELCLGALVVLQVMTLFNLLLSGSHRGAILLACLFLLFPLADFLQPSLVSGFVSWFPGAVKC